MKRAGFLELHAEARDRLAGGALPRLMVIAGEEPYHKESLLEVLRAREGATVEIFARRADESEGDAFLRLLDAWTTASLFARDEILIAREAESLLGAHASTRLSRLGELATRLEGEPPAHHLVLTMRSLDGRSKLAKRLKQDDGLVSLPLLRDSPPPWMDSGPTHDTELNQWLVAEARRREWRLGLDAADALSRRIGNEPARLVRAIEQLAVLIEERDGTGGRQRRISADDVRAHVLHTSARLMTLFDESLERGDVADALSLLDRMRHEGVYDHNQRLVSGVEADDTLLRGLATRLAKLIDAHERLGPDLVGALGRPPWKRSAAESEALNAALGAGGRRVFLERDLRRIPAAGAADAFDQAVAGLRALRDGTGLSMHATTVRLSRSLGGRR